MAYGNTSYGGGSGAGSASFPPSTVDVAGAGTRDQRVGAGGALLAPINDDYVARLNMSGLSGASSFIVQNASLEATEPAQADVSSTGTVWWTWAPGTNGLGTVSSDLAVVIDAFLDGGGLAALTPLAGAPGTGDSTTFDVRVGETYAIRAYGASAADAASHALNWSVTLAPLDFLLATTTIPWAPGSVTAYISNDVPGATTVDLAFDGGVTVQTVTTDAEGNVTFPLNIPELAVGAHTVTATSSSGKTATINFTVQNTDSFTPPTPPTPPTPVSGAASRWFLQDPVTAETWQFPINPKTEGATTLPRVLSAHWTTAIPDGQPIVFEGGRPARPWEFKGEVLTLADLEVLRGWQRPYRIYLTDDLERTFVVKIKRVASQPVGNSNDVQHPEHHTYTVSALLFGVAP